MKQMEEVEENVGGSFGSNVNPQNFKSDNWFKWLVIGLIAIIAAAIVFSAWTA